MWTVNLCMVVFVISNLLLFPNKSAAASGKILYRFQGGTSGQWPTGALVTDSAGNLYGKALNTMNPWDVQTTIANSYSNSQSLGEVRGIIKYSIYLLDRQLTALAGWCWIVKATSTGLPPLEAWTGKEWCLN